MTLRPINQFELHTTTQFESVNKVLEEKSPRGQNELERRENDDNVQVIFTNTLN